MWVWFWAQRNTGEILVNSRVPLFLLEITRQSKSSVKLLVDKVNNCSYIFHDIDLFLDVPFLEHKLSSIKHAMLHQELRTAVGHSLLLLVDRDDRSCGKILGELLDDQLFVIEAFQIGRTLD